MHFERQPPETGFEVSDSFSDIVRYLDHLLSEINCVAQGDKNSNDIYEIASFRLKQKSALGLSSMATLRDTDFGSSMFC